MIFPRIDRTPSGYMVVTGRIVHADGTLGALAGYLMRNPAGELVRLRELDRREPRFSKAVLDRDYPLKESL